MVKSQDALVPAAAAALVPKETQQTLCRTWPAAAPQSQAQWLPHMIMET